jgi:hypothetical protein
MSSSLRVLPCTVQSPHSLAEYYPEKKHTNGKGDQQAKTEVPGKFVEGDEYTVGKNGNKYEFDPLLH